MDDPPSPAAIVMRWIPLLVLLACTKSEPDLLKMPPLAGKGRAQDSEDNPRNPVVAALVARGAEAIPFLVARLESERRYEHSVLPYWPDPREGDVALVLLSDFIVDESGRRSTLPELCWDALVPPDPAGVAPAWERFREVLERQGRQGLRRKWAAAWREHGRDIYWDETGEFFRVRSRPLQPCSSSQPRRPPSSRESAHS